MQTFKLEESDFAEISRGFDVAARQFAALSIPFDDANRALSQLGEAMRLVDTSELEHARPSNWVQRHYRRIRDRKGRR